jgi:hypothetical protein
MSSQGWVSLLNDQWQIGAGTALSASAATATISPQNATTKDYLISPYEWRVNKMLLVYADGILGSGGTASNLSVFLAAGGTPTTLATTPAMALGTGSLSSLPWHMWARIRCTAVASSGNTLETKGTFIFNNATAPALGTANAVMADLPLTNAAVDLSTSCAIMLRATLSAAFGNITCHSFIVKSIN